MLEITTQYISEKVKLLAEANPDIAVVWLYGSRAKSTEHDGSDFDLAVAFRNFSLPPFDKYARPNELALDWACELGLSSEQISVVDINQAPVYLAYNIVEYGNAIYQDDSARAFYEQDRIYAQYEHQQLEAKHD